jgi:dihydrofolate reductase
MTQTKVAAEMSMSLDGFIADENDGTDQLFGWYFGGDVEIPAGGFTFKVTAASADFLRPALSGGVGALVCGRRVFDLTQGWGGRHPLGCPVFVVSHSVPTDRHGAHFFTDPMEALAAAKAAAGDRTVAVATPSIAQHYLDAGALDEISVSLVPVLLGKGIRFFDNLAKTPIRLSDPIVYQGEGVTHLTYQVR